MSAHTPEPPGLSPSNRRLYGPVMTATRGQKFCPLGYGLWSASDFYPLRKKKKQKIRDASYPQDPAPTIYIFFFLTLVAMDRD